MDPLTQQQIGRYRVGSASASNTGDSAEPLFSCILPEDLISEILSERLEERFFRPSQRTLVQF